MSEKPRLLLVSDDPRIDTGFGRVIREIGLHLTNTGRYEVFQHGWFSQNLRDRQVPWKVFPTLKTQPNHVDPRDTYGALSFDRVCEHVRPHLVLGLGNPGMLVAAAFSRLRDTYRLVVYTPIDGFPAPQDFRRVYDAADRVVLFCPWAQDVIERWTGVRCDATIPHGVDIETFHPRSVEQRRALKHQLLGDADSFIVGFVGRNLERKRVDQLIQAVALVRHGHYTVTPEGEVAHGFNGLGTLVPQTDGTPGSPAAVKLLLHAALKDPGGPNLDPTIQLFDMGGAIYCDQSYKVAQGCSDRELSELYGCMDCFLSISTEGWGCTGLEAAASGLPLILGRWSAPADWAADSALWVDAAAWHADMYSGLQRPCPNPSQMVRHIRKLMSCPAARDSWSRKARRMARRYAWSRVGAQWEPIIDETLAGRHTPRLIQI